MAVLLLCGSSLPALLNSSVAYSPSGIQGAVVPEPARGIELGGGRMKGAEQATLGGPQDPLDTVSV